MLIEIVGFPEAKMWTDDMSASDARRSIVENVPADAVLPVRVYMVAPPGTTNTEFKLKVSTQDAEPETAETDVRFTGVGE